MLIDTAVRYPYGIGNLDKKKFAPPEDSGFISTPSLAPHAGILFPHEKRAYIESVVQERFQFEDSS